jgi:uncharacterized membrane protein YtjA (UPF0391 family)
MTFWRALFLLAAVAAGHIGLAGGGWQGVLGQIAFFIGVIGLLVSLVLGSAGEARARAGGGSSEYRAASGG